MNYLSLNRQSLFVFKLAIVIEIGVVLIGLGISLATAFSAIEAKASYATIFIAAAPFVMVALCEFSKIPLAMAIWHSKKSKILYIVFTLLVCMITFETLFNGFERNFAALSFSAKRTEIERDANIATIQDNEEKIAYLKKGYVNEKKEIATKVANNLAIEEQKIQKAKSSSATNQHRLSANRSKLAKKQQELEKLSDEKARLLAELSEKQLSILKNQSSDLSDKNKVRARQVSQLERRIAVLHDSMENEIEDAFLTSSKQQIRISYTQQINSLQTQLNKLIDGGLSSESDPDMSFQVVKEQYALMLEVVEDKIRQKREEIAAIEELVTKQSKAATVALSHTINQIKKSTKTQNIKLEHDSEQLESTYTNTLAEIDKIRDTNFEIKKKIRYINSTIEELYLSNQIYRMASHVDGTDELAEIKPQTVSLVAVVWFGSLAFICSIVGPVLVLLSLHLNSKSSQAKLAAY